MTSYLITGGTGALGRPTVAALHSTVAQGKDGAPSDIRVLSRRRGEGHAVGDVTTGAGLDEALRGADTVLHLANGGSREARGTENLLSAARRAGVTHLVYISIVGVDRIPFAYYRQKVAAERLVEASGIPYTILRATQFHGFVTSFLDAQRRLPITVVLPVSVQSIAVDEVADRLVELAVGSPAGHVADVGGPERMTLREAAAAWQHASGIRRPVVAIPLRGRAMAAFRAGHHMTPAPGPGIGTFAAFLARRTDGVE